MLKAETIIILINEREQKGKKEGNFGMFSCV